MKTHAEFGTTRGMTPTCRDHIFRDPSVVTHWLRTQAEFFDWTAGGDSFHVARIPSDVAEVIMSSVVSIMGVPIDMEFLVARLSTDTIDSDVRIHTDFGMGTTHACVWYGTDPPEEPVSSYAGYGTAFFDHHVHGIRFRGEKDEHDRLLREDAGDLQKFNFQSLVPMKENRLVVYPSDLFHSRYPFEGWGTSQQDGRVVIVGFFSERPKENKHGG